MSATTLMRKQEREQAIEQLQKLLKPGDKVYTVLRHVSASGMSRRIDLYTIKDNRPIYLTGYAAKALGLRRSPKKEGVTVGGCGMDMGFHLVYELSGVLFRDGFKVNGVGRNGDTSGHDNDGGYALKHEWL